MGLIMTLKKCNKSGQSVLEYFILTIIMVSVCLFFAQNKTFIKIQKSCDNGFNKAVGEILK